MPIFSKTTARHFSLATLAFTPSLSKCAQRLWLYGLFVAHIRTQGAKIHIVVMENVAHHRKGRLSSQYDLKGSWYAGASSVSHEAPTLTSARVARQVLNDSAAARRQLESGCKRHEGTLKDLDMAFSARVLCTPSSNLCSSTPE
jgi:hypothetical protein